MVSHTVSHTNAIRKKILQKKTYQRCVAFISQRGFSVHNGTCSHALQRSERTSSDLSFDQGNHGAEADSVCRWYHVRTQQCLNKNSSSQFHKQQRHCLYHEAPFIALLMMDRLKASWFVEYNGSDPLLCRNTWITNNAYSARGW